MRDVLILFLHLIVTVVDVQDLVLQHPVWIEKTRIVCFRNMMQVLWNVVDEGGFEPPASSLRTRENLR